jgi:serine/threonine protein phosphatase PrpC
MDNPPNIRITAFGKTDVGLIREHNEDNLLIADISRGDRQMELKDVVTMELGPKGALFLVCDGMGGAAAGEVASQMAVESIAGTLEAAEPLTRDPFARRLRHAIEDANDRIFAQSRDNQSERGMGTTCTAVAFVDGTLVVGQIGDSRCYVIRSGRLAQVTKDQSLAWQLMEAGAMTAEEAKGFEHANIILQALGVQERVEVVMSQVELRRGDVVLLSSDGLHGPVTDEEILQILQEESDLKRACDRLVNRALEREGPDNITVVIAKVDGPGLPEPKPQELVDFVPYDPGYDHSEPPRVRQDLGEKVTVEVTLPKEAIRLTGQGGPIEGMSYPPGAVGRLAGGASRSETSAVLSFLLLTLLAATAAGAFVKCDRNRVLQRETQAAALSEAAAAGTPAPAAEAAGGAAGPGGATAEPAAAAEPADPPATPAPPAKTGAAPPARTATAAAAKPPAAAAKAVTKPGAPAPAKAPAPTAATRPAGAPPPATPNAIARPPAVRKAAVKK